MNMATLDNPFGGPPLTVDKLIGNAFPIVKSVFENLPFIKHVSDQLESIYDVAQKLDELIALYGDLDKLNSLYLIKDQVVALANQIANVVLVAQNIPAIQDLSSHMADLLNIQVILNAFYADLEKVEAALATSYAFANGAEDATVETEQGIMPTIAGLVKQVNDSQNLIVKTVNLQPYRYQTLADLNADLSRIDGYKAVVIADPVATNNVMYLKNGEPNTGSWTPLPDRLLAATGDARGYLASVIGAALRTYTNKIQEVKSILDFVKQGEEPADWADVFDKVNTWALAAGGGELLLPARDYVYHRDIRILAHNLTIRGDGASSRLLATNNAKFYVGQATYINNGTSVPDKGGFKVLHCRLYRFSVKPADGHVGSCAVIDYADNTIIDALDFGPYGNDGSVVSHGLDLNWVQYTTCANVSANVNGSALRILLNATTTENEDHFTFYNCWLYNGKYRNANYTPACVSIAVSALRGAAIFHIGFYGCHFLYAMNNLNALDTNGIRIERGGPNDFRVVRCGLLSSCLFEGPGYPLDMSGGVGGGGADTSRWKVDSTSFLVFTTAFRGKDVSKGAISCSNADFLQGVQIGSGVRTYWEGCNTQDSITGSLFNEDISAHRFSNKGPAGSLTGVVLEQSGQFTVPNGQDTVDIPHQLFYNPNKFSITPGWLTNYWIGASTGNTFRVIFGTPPTGDSKVYWTAGLYDN